MSKQSLLLVDGDTRSLRVLEVSLRKAGFSVTPAVSVGDALDKLEVNAPDLIISETKFSTELDGFELRRRLRNTPGWADIPFIFLTAETAIENKIKGLELGVDDYLTKPIYIKEIVTRINILLQKRQRQFLDLKKDGTRFAGRVADMPVVDVIQTIEVSRKAGVIQFSNGPTRTATIYFRDGKVIDAEAGTLQGEDAVYRLLTWNEGEFEVEFRTVRRRETIATSSQGLLMEGMRRLDEWSRLLEQLPPLSHRFEIDAGELSSRLGEIPDDNNRILRLFDGKRTLLEVIDASDFGDLECLQAISRLYFEGLLIDLDPGVRSRRDTGKSGPHLLIESPPITPMEEVVSGPIDISALDLRLDAPTTRTATASAPLGATRTATPTWAAELDSSTEPVSGAIPPRDSAARIRRDSAQAIDESSILTEEEIRGPLSGGYRPSSLRLIDEAVAAAQAIEPSLFDSDELAALGLTPTGKFFADEVAEPAAIEQAPAETKLARVKLEKKPSDPRIETARDLVEKMPTGDRRTPTNPGVTGRTATPPAGVTARAPTNPNAVTGLAPTGPDVATSQKPTPPRGTPVNPNVLTGRTPTTNVVRGQTPAGGTPTSQKLRTQTPTAPAPYATRTPTNPNLLRGQTPTAPAPYIGRTPSDPNLLRDAPPGTPTPPGGTPTPPGGTATPPHPHVVTGRAPSNPNVVTGRKPTPQGVPIARTPTPPAGVAMGRTPTPPTVTTPVMGRTPTPPPVTAPVMGRTPTPPPVTAPVMGRTPTPSPVVGRTPTPPPTSQTPEPGIALGRTPTPPGVRKPTPQGIAISRTPTPPGPTNQNVVTTRGPADPSALPPRTPTNPGVPTGRAPTNPALAAEAAVSAAAPSPVGANGDRRDSTPRTGDDEGPVERQSYRTGEIPVVADSVIDAALDDSSGVPTAIGADEAHDVSDEPTTDPSRRRLDKPVRREDSQGLRMIGSLGRDRAEASGEVRAPSFKPSSPVEPAEPQRELVTILPRRITREIAIATPEGDKPADASVEVDTSAAKADARTDARPDTRPETKPDPAKPAVEPPSSPPRRVSIAGGVVRRSRGPGRAASLLLVIAALLVTFTVITYIRKNRKQAVVTAPHDAGTFVMEMPDADERGFGVDADIAMTPSDAAVAMAPPDAKVSAPRDAAVAVAPVDAKVSSSRDAGTVVVSIVDAGIDKGKEARALYDKGHSALEDGDPEEALRLLDESLKLRKAGRTYLERARALQRMNRIDEAVASVDGALALKKDDAKAYEQKGMILWSAQRYGEARPALEKYLELAPNGRKAEMIRGMLDENK